MYVVKSSCFECKILKLTFAMRGSYNQNQYCRDTSFVSMTKTLKEIMYSINEMSFISETPYSDTHPNQEVKFLFFLERLGESNRPDSLLQKWQKWDQYSICFVLF